MRPITGDQAWAKTGTLLSPWEDSEDRTEVPAQGKNGRSGVITDLKTSWHEAVLEFLP